jgi:lipopolysaccharide biosynthesis regulator YciM
MNEDKATRYHRLRRRAVLLAAAWRVLFLAALVPTGTAQALRVLKAYHQQYPSLDLLNTVFALTLAEEGPATAGALIKDELARNPTLLGLDRLLEAQLLAAPAERRHDLELVKQLVGQHIKRLGMYKCDHCGFRAKQYYWRCPGCNKWETYSPRRTETPDYGAA